MNNYITGAVIKSLREKKKLTQMQLADILNVSGKTVSKWETAKGLPDITLIEPLACALSVSVAELMSGEAVVNKNTGGNIQKSKFYVCPVCGNVFNSLGEAHISCCGITLPILIAEEADETHGVKIEDVENERFITINHDMTKAHYISFIAYVTYDKSYFVKLYPESSAQARIPLSGKGTLYFYCNKDGLMSLKV